jgi:hypothetical protein
MGTVSSFPRVKQQGREADHSPPASAEVKKNVDLYIHFPICLHGIVLNFKHRDSFTLFTGFYVKDIKNQNDIHDKVKGILNSGNAFCQTVQKLLFSTVLSENIKIKPLI